MKTRSFFAGIIGNILEHYDTALYGLLAPFMAPYFFQEQDPVTALILTYAIYPVGIVAKLLGAWFFPKMGLRGSLFGTALCTMAIGFLPPSPLLLALTRFGQSFFAAGEVAGGAQYVLSTTSESKRTFASSLFDSSTVAGALIASGLIAYFGGECWRWLFFAAGFTGLIGVAFRRGEILVKPDNERDEKSAFLSIVTAAGFSYVTYAFTFSLMNGYVPLVTHFTKKDMAAICTGLFVLDLLALPLFGLLAKRIGKERLMRTAAMSAAVMTPLALLIPMTSLLSVVVVRTLIALPGIAFAAPYHAWARDKTRNITTLCFGYTLGAQVIGAPTAAISLWLYKTSGLVGLYYIPIALLAAFTLRSQRRWALG